MSRSKSYRSLAAAALSAAALALGACSGAPQTHDTMRHEQYNRWDLSRVAIIYQLAEQQYKVGDFDKCRKTCDEGFGVKPDFAPLHVLIAKVELEKGSLEAAANHLKEALRINPSDPEPYYILGVVYQRWQNAEVAHDYYQQAWDRKANEVRYMLALVEMKITLGRVEEAQKLLEDRLVYFEQTAAVRVALARLATLKNDYAGASKYYRDALLLQPEDENVRRAYGESLFFAGRNADALPVVEELYKKADAAGQETLALLLGRIYLNLHRPIDARNILQSVCRDHPANNDAFLELGQACIQTGDLSIALSAGRHILKTTPDNVPAMIVVALTQQKQKKWADSLSTLQAAARLAPADSTVLCMLGVSLQQTGHADEASACFAKAVQANPNDTWAHELLNAAKPLGRADLDVP
jgi:tetratricopeptide (TPR) repeat protein